MTKTPTEQKIIEIIENVTGKAAKVCERKFYDKPKSLTEQWREGTLKGYYYVHIKLDERCEYDDIDLIDELTGNFELHCDDYIKEVLAPVPSYEEYKEMDNDLKEIASKNDSLAMDNGRLKEQQKEANEAIMSMVGNGPHTADEIGQSYIEKWGVK